MIAYSPELLSWDHRTFGVWWSSLTSPQREKTSFFFFFKGSKWTVKETRVNKAVIYLYTRCQQVLCAAFLSHFWFNVKSIFIQSGGGGGPFAEEKCFMIPFRKPVHELRSWKLRSDSTYSYLLLSPPSLHNQTTSCIIHEAIETHVWLHLWHFSCNSHRVYLHSVNPHLVFKSSGGGLYIRVMVSDVLCTRGLRTDWDMNENTGTVVWSCDVQGAQCKGYMHQSSMHLLLMWRECHQT